MTEVKFFWFPVKTIFFSAHQNIYHLRFFLLKCFFDRMTKTDFFARTYFSSSSVLSDDFDFGFGEDFGLGSVSCAASILRFYFFRLFDQTSNSTRSAFVKGQPILIQNSDKGCLLVPAWVISYSIVDHKLFIYDLKQPSPCTKQDN